jgi:hypothetical protein
MSEDTRLCVDCRFANRDDNALGPRWTCAQPSSLRQPDLSLVTGVAQEPYQMPCEEARSFGELDSALHLCGRIGRHWQPRGIG